MHNNNKRFIEALQLLAIRLNKDEYTQITDIMYNLFCGLTYEYEEDDVYTIMADIKRVQREIKKKKYESFKVIKGSKNNVK
jgi:protein involved in ribonucleotide reduction